MSVPATPASADATRTPRRLVFTIEALTVGGAERMLVVLANGFAAMGDEVHVVLLSRSGELAAELAPEVHRHPLGKRPGIDPSLVPRLRALLRRLRPDAVNSHLWVANFWTRLALVGTGLRVVVTEHSRDTWKSPLHRALDRALVPFTDTLVAVSTDTAEFYRREIGVPAALLHVINNGIDTARYAAGDGRALRAEWEPSGGRLLLGIVGRLVPAKNHVRALEALAMVHARGGDATLVIVGDGPERERIEATVERLGLGAAVRLAGPRADVPDVLAALDVFVLSSDREGHPLAVLEAQAAGTPVVATRVGGTPEALARDDGAAGGEGVGGVLVAPDAAALADAIHALETDRATLARLADVARRHSAARFDVRRMLERYAAVFDESGPTPPPGAERRDARVYSPRPTTASARADAGASGTHLRPDAGSRANGAVSGVTQTTIGRTTIGRASLEGARPAASVAGTAAIAFVIESLSVGGAERMLVAMANAFAAAGRRVEVLCLAEAGALANELSDGVGLHVLGKRPGLDPRLPARLRRLVRRLAPDVVNSHLWVANLWTRVALAGTGRRIVVTEHNRDDWKNSLYRRADRWLVPVTDLLIAVSEDTARFYRDDVGIPAAKVHVINNGIDVRRHASGDGAALKRQWTPGGAFLIGSVGRLAPAKNYLRLVEATRLLIDAGHAVRTVIVGEGPERARIEARIDELGLADAVTLAGARADVPDVLAALDLFVLSSDREGHPLAALEAQAAGTPVVLTRAGGNADAIAVDGDMSGGVLSEADAASLARRIGELIADPNRLAAMSAFARRHAFEHFDTRHMVARYATVFG